jgi:MYXO-CTERM domain-containing protein
MRIITAIAIAAAVTSAPALAQDANNAATAADNAAAAPATDTISANTMTANDVVLAPGEATTVTPVAPVEPTESAAPAERDDGGRIPWGLLGLLGLVGLLGRSRKRRDEV